MEYFGMVPGQSSRLSKVTKWFVAAVAVYMGIRGVQAGLWYYIPFALALVVVAFYRKEQALTDQGVDFRRVFIVYKTHDIWPWEEVTRIIADYETMKPTAMLLISRGSKNRQILMVEEEAKKIVQLATKKNPKIVLQTQDASGRHTAYQYNGSTRNERKAAQGKPVRQAEDFKTVKEEIRREQERLERIASAVRPDLKTAAIKKPSRKLKGFH